MDWVFVRVAIHDITCLRSLHTRGAFVADCTITHLIVFPQAYGIQIQISTMDTRAIRGVDGLPDVRMATPSNDIIMETARSGTTLKNNKFQLWERELLESPEVRRKSTVAQLCTWCYARIQFMLKPSPDFLDYYFQLLGYISGRKERRAIFNEDTASRNLSPTDYNKEFKSYCGRERVLLRRRRAKLRVEQFHIIAQVGQGGYGEVYLARKKETGEVCALKKMRKRTLFKMDEVRRRFLPAIPILSLTRFLPGQTCSRRAGHSHCDENALVGPFAVRLSRCKACLPRDGICAWRRLSDTTQ